MNQTSPLRAMFWKEMREGLKWAALLLVAMLVAVVIVLGNHRGVRFNTNDYTHQGMPLLVDDFQAVMIIASAVGGLLLGLTQTLPEKRLDKWAFLIHRPVSRTTLFMGKVIAGLVLYALAIGVPYVVAVIWCATPGHVPAPFQPAMMLAGIADLLAGAMYYFASILIGMREARWYGSRILALGLPIVGSFGVFIVPEFGYAVLVIAFVTAVMATAAWGSFTAGGNYAPQPRVAKVALGIVVFAGIVLAGGFAVAVLSELLPKPIQGYTWTDYVTTPDGKILRRTQHGFGNQTQFNITDLAGNPMPEYSDALTFQQKIGMPPTASLWVGDERPGTFMVESYHRPERYYVALPSASSARGSTLWYYYVIDKGYAVGYDTRSRRVAGYFTPDGFLDTATEPAKRFPGKPSADIYWSNPYRLTFATGQYELDVFNRHVIPRFQPPAGERLISGASAVQAVVHQQDIPQTENKALFDAFATTSRLYVQTPDGKPIFNIPLNLPSSEYGMMSVAQPEKTDRYFVWYQPSYASDAVWKLPQIVQEISATGQMLARQELPPVPLNVAAYAPFESIFIGAAAPPAGIATMMVAPVLAEGRSMEDVRNDPNLSTALRATLVSGVLCALLTFALGRRYSLTRGTHIGWTIANFVLGPAGVLTMLSLWKWPTRERCPACGRARVANREQCPRCAAPFSPPAMDGTDIFAARR